jgi:hypothetical protein
MPLVRPDAGAAVIIARMRLCAFQSGEENCVATGSDWAYTALSQGIIFIHNEKLKLLSFLQQD